MVSVTGAPTALALNHLTKKLVKKWIALFNRSF